MPQTLTQTPFTMTDGPQRHAGYAELAAAGSVHRITLPTGKPAWLITGYHQVRRALQDARLLKSLAAAANLGRDLVPPGVFAAMASHMLNANPPSQVTRPQAT